MTVAHISAERNTRCNMNTKKLIGTSMIALLVVAMGAGMAAAYTIDGDLSDWGVNVDGGNWALDATWEPNAGVQFQVEDNVDPDSASEWHGVGTTTLAYATGKHIAGTGSSHVIYDEARVPPSSTSIYKGWAYPVGGDNTAEKYDQEAMYVDDTNSTYLYFAIVLSCNAKDYAGDLGLDITGTTSDGYAYEYGVAIWDNAGTYTASSRTIYSMPTWSTCTYVPESSPARITAGNPVGTATVAYKNIGDQESLSVATAAKDTYIIEGKIPRSAFGSDAPAPGDMPLGKWHYTVVCGNDQIPIPEFGVLAVPIIALMGLVFFMRRRKS